MVDMRAAGIRERRIADGAGIFLLNDHALILVGRQSIATQMLRKYLIRICGLPRQNAGLVIGWPLFVPCLSMRNRARFAVAFEAVSLVAMKIIGWLSDLASAAGFRRLHGLIPNLIDGDCNLPQMPVTALDAVLETEETHCGSILLHPGWIKSASSDCRPVARSPFLSQWHFGRNIRDAHPSRPERRDFRRGDFQ